MDNTALFFLIHNLSGKSIFLDRLMIAGAEILIYIVFTLMAVGFYFGISKDKKAFLFSIISLVFSLIIIQIIHLFYFEPRPFTTFSLTPLIKDVWNYSFPSVHTTTAATIAFSYLLYNSKLAPLFILFLIWIGFARIFVGVHYPLDILGGVFVGALSVSIIWSIKNWLKTKL